MNNKKVSIMTKLCLEDLKRINQLLKVYSLISKDYRENKNNEVDELNILRNKSNNKINKKRFKYFSEIIWPLINPKFAKTKRIIIV